jgi:hypothetical protein
MPSDILEPELGAAGLPGFPAPGGYIDGAVAFQGMFHLLVHRPSPVAWMAPTSAEYPSFRRAGHYSAITGRAQA